MTAADTDRYWKERNWNASNYINTEKSRKYEDTILRESGGDLTKLTYSKCESENGISPILTNQTPIHPFSMPLRAPGSSYQLQANDS